MKFVAEVSASFPDKIIDLSPYLTNIAINYDYMNNIMPMWAFSFLLPFDIKDILQREDFTVPIRIFSVTRANTDDDPYSADEDIIYDELIYEDEIVEYVKTRSNFKQVTDENQEQMDVGSIPFSISGLSKPIMEINSSILNGYYRDTNSLNALSASIQDLNNKIKIVTNYDNMATKYDQIIIPPMNLIPAIRHLITYYPIYDTNTGLFFNDKDHLHIFTDRLNSLINRVDIEIVEESQDEEYNPSDYMISKRGDNYWHYKTNTVPVFETSKKITDNALGINKTVYSYDEAFNLRDGAVNDVANNYEKNRVYWDPLGEDTNLSIMKNVYDKNRVSSLFILGADPRIFDQYTYINFEGVDSVDYLKGRYSVKSKTELFVSKEDNRRILDIEMTLSLDNVIE